MKIIGIYHNADFDGLLSREVVKFFEPEATLIGWNYGDPVPEIPPDVDLLYLVDISIPELMDHPALVWIDHHKTAIEQFGARRGFQLDGVAACRLAWQWFNDTKPTFEEFRNRTVEEPELLRLAGEHDIWDHRDPNARTLQFGLRALPEDVFQSLVRLQFLGKGEDDLENTLRLGRGIQDYCAKQDAEFSVKCSQTVHWEGLRLCALNTGRPGNSDVFAAAVDPEKHDALLAWRYFGGKVLVSLYHAPHRKDLDLSEIAKKYGGGGHRGACGFQATLGFMEGILSR